MSIKEKLSTGISLFRYCQFLEGPCTGASCDIVSFLDANAEFTAQRLDEVRSILERASFEEFKEIAVLVVGSDARLENAPGSVILSPLDLCILGRNPEIIRQAKDRILQLTDAGILEHVDRRIEVKHITPNENGPVFSGYLGNPHHPWPDRILDAQLIIGDQKLREFAREKVFQEWNSQGAIRKAFTNNFNRIIKIICTGTKGKNSHFDFTKGELFFEPDKYIRGLKYGPIRAIQMFLTLHQMKHNGTDGNLPLRTRDKLRALYPDSPDIVAWYDWALVLYHAQQYRRAIGETENIQVNPEMLQEMCRHVFNFCQLDNL